MNILKKVGKLKQDKNKNNITNNIQLNKNENINNNSNNQNLQPNNSNNTLNNTIQNKPQSISTNPQLNSNNLNILNQQNQDQNDINSTTNNQLQKQEQNINNIIGKQSVSSIISISSATSFNNNNNNNTNSNSNFNKPASKNALLSKLKKNINNNQNQQSQNISAPHQIEPIIKLEETQSQSNPFFQLTSSNNNSNINNNNNINSIITNKIIGGNSLLSKIAQKKEQENKILQPQNKFFNLNSNQDLDSSMDQKDATNFQNKKIININKNPFQKNNVIQQKPQLQKSNNNNINNIQINNQNNLQNQQNQKINFKNMQNFLDDDDSDSSIDNIQNLLNIQKQKSNKILEDVKLQEQILRDNQQFQEEKQLIQSQKQQPNQIQFNFPQNQNNQNENTSNFQNNIQNNTNNDNDNSINLQNNNNNNSINFNSNPYNVPKLINQSNLSNIDQNNTSFISQNSNSRINEYSGKFSVQCFGNKQEVKKYFENKINKTPLKFISKFQQKHGNIFEEIKNLTVEEHPCWRYIAQNKYQIEDLESYYENMKDPQNYQFLPDPFYKFNIYNITNNPLYNLPNQKIPKINLIVIDYEIYMDVVTLKLKDFSGEIQGSVPKRLFSKDQDDQKKEEDQIIEEEDEEQDDIQDDDNKIKNKFQKKEKPPQHVNFQFAKQMHLKLNCLLYLENVSVIQESNQEPMYLNISTKNIIDVYYPPVSI